MSKSNYCATPNRLMNYALERTGLEKDFDLAEKLGVHHSLICRIRSGASGISDNLLAALVRVIPNSSLADLYRLAGIERKAA